METSRGFVRYSSPATAALGRLVLPYLFPELSAFATVEDLITHLRTSESHYRAALPAEFLNKNPPPKYITLYLKVTCLLDPLRTVRDRFLSLDPTDLTVDLLEKHLLAAETSDVGAASDPTGKRRSGKGKGGGGGSGVGGGGGSGGGGGGGGGSGSGGGSGGFGGGGGGSDGSGDGGGGGGGGSGGGRGGAAQRGGSGGGQSQQRREWFSQRGATEGSVRCPYVIRTGDRTGETCGNAEGDCYQCVPPDLGIEAAALGASESALPGTAHAKALHTFTLDSGASRCFFRDSTSLTLLPAPVVVRLADPSGDPVLASSFTVLPCPAVPSGSLSGLHFPSFSTNLPLARVTSCHTKISFGTIALVTPPCHAFVACTPTSLFLVFPGLCLPSRPRLPRPAFLASRGGSAPLLTPRFPRRLLPCRLSTWTFRLQLRERFHQDIPVLRLHSERGGEFSSDLLRDFCRGEGILQSFTLPASPQQSDIAERHIGLVMEFSRTSMIHAAAPHFLWPFAVWYAAHQLNLWPRVSLPETSPTLRWMGRCLLPLVGVPSTSMLF
ncbi:unnamed protein product [Closterium sp. NIES-53]